MSRILILAIAGGLAVAGPIPAKADPTPALPFFSKPFPTGYADNTPACIERRLVRTARGWRRRAVDLCGPVLHARD